jgi:hypothetical protein
MSYVPVRHFDIVINKQKSSVNLVYLPLIKNVPGSLNSLAQAQANPPQKIEKKPLNTSITEKEKGNLLVKNEPPKEPIKPSVKPLIKPISVQSSAMQAKKELIQELIKEQPKKIALQKEQKKTPKKVEKEQPKKKELIKKMAESKPLAKHEAKKINQTQKKNEEKKEIKHKEKPLDCPIAPLIANKKEENSAPLEKQQEEVIYIGREEKALIALHELVQQEITACWRPPVGLSDELSCVIKIKISAQGIIDALDIERSSQVLSYDIAARNALYHISFPKGLWGQEVVITFKQ